MQKIIYILLLFPMFVFGQTPAWDTCNKAVPQYFLIPENVSNGDYVGELNCSFAQDTLSSIVFTEDESWLGVSSGILTITDAADINGKVVQDDTIREVLITVTDGDCSDTATAYVKIIENDFCVFVDNGNDGTGTRADPRSNLGAITVTTKYSYFFKRDSVFDDNKAIHGVNSFNLATYDQGDRPEFNGAAAENICLQIGSPDGLSPSDSAGIYSLNIRKWGHDGIQFREHSDNYIVSNCLTDSNCLDNLDANSNAGIYTIEEDDGSWDGANYNGLIVNHRSRYNLQNGYKLEHANSSGINLEAGWNNDQVPTNGYGVRRVSTAGHINLEHVWSHHNLECGIQDRVDSSTLTYGKFNNNTLSGIFREDDGRDSLVYQYIISKDNLVSGVLSYDDVRGIYFLDCDFSDNGNHGMDIASYQDGVYIKRCLSDNNTNDGIRFRQSDGTDPTNVNVEYSISINNGNYGIYATAASVVYARNCVSVKNTSDDFNGMDSLINCYLQYATNTGYGTNNSDVDTLTTATTFEDYANDDYQHKSTAWGIDQGYDWGHSGDDYYENTVPFNSTPDRGPDEYTVFGDKIPIGNGTQKKFILSGTRKYLYRKQ